MIQFSLIKNPFFLFSIIACLFFSCKKDNAVNPEPDVFKYMTVNRNGVDYESLISVSKKLGGTATTVGLFQNSEKFLKLQGNHSDFEINVRIPEDFWKVGTYTLEEGAGSLNPNCFVTLIDNFNYDFNIAGEITITTFDLTDRIFKATFNFSSPDNTVTGTLDYPLDDEEFD